MIVKITISRSWWGRLLIPDNLGGWGRKIKSSRSSWDTEWVQDHPGQFSEILFSKAKAGWRFMSVAELLHSTHKALNSNSRTPNITSKHTSRVNMHVWINRVALCVLKEHLLNLMLSVYMKSTSRHTHGSCISSHLCIVVIFIQVKGDSQFNVYIQVDSFLYLRCNSNYTIIFKYFK